MYAERVRRPHHLPRRARAQAQARVQTRARASTRQLVPSPAVEGETMSAVGLASMMLFIAVAAARGLIGHCEARLHSLKASCGCGGVGGDWRACGERRALRQRPLPRRARPRPALGRARTT